MSNYCFLYKEQYIQYMLLFSDSDLNRNGYPPFPRQNGNVPLDTSYDPEFENEMNRRNASKLTILTQI